MARQRSPNRDKGFEIYKEHKGDITNREIANKLNEDEKKIAVWKQRDKWDNNSNVVQQKKKRCTTNKNDNKKSTKKQVIADEIKEVMENGELTEQQKLFCIYYSKCFNQTKAYQKAYNCGYATANSNASKLMVNTSIKAMIDQLTEITITKEVLKRGLLQQYIDIAFADITDYIEFGYDERIQYDKDGHPKLDEEGKIKTEIYNYLRLGESKKVDGRLITEVSEGRDGIKIKLADKMKALDFLTKHCNLLSDEEKTKLDLEYKRLQNAKTQLDIENSRGDSKGNEAKLWAEAIQEIAAKRCDKNG